MGARRLPARRLPARRLPAHPIPAAINTHLSLGPSCYFQLFVSQLKMASQMSSLLFDNKIAVCRSFKAVTMEELRAWVSDH
jgi:hypothetical protein